MQSKSKLWCLAAAIAILFAANAVAQEENKSNKKPNSVSVGEKAPDFDLPTFDDKTVKLSERFGEQGKHVILLFSRAHW